jgi:hypothetical protein
MTRFVTIDQLSAGPEQMPRRHVSPSHDIYTPKIEDLLRRLAQTNAPVRDVQPRFRFGPWALLATFLISICVPGCAAAAIFLIKSQGVDPARTRQALARADRLDLSETSVRNGSHADESQVRFRARINETLNVADVLEPITFRGSIEGATLTVLSAGPAPSPKRKLKRTAVHIPAPKPPAEPPQPEARAPSLLERLFGMNAPATTQAQTPPQT